MLSPSTIEQIPLRGRPFQVVFAELVQCAHFSRGGEAFTERIRRERLLRQKQERRQQKQDLREKLQIEKKGTPQKLIVREQIPQDQNR